MSKANKPSLITHLVLALITSYGLSVFFWLTLGVFNLIGFIVVSALAAALGLASGMIMQRRLWITVFATLLVRIGLYLLMTRGL